MYGDSITGEYMKNYEKHLYNQSAPGGELTVWTVPFPAEATLIKLIVKQVDGAAVAFNIDVCNSAKVFTDYTPDPDLFLVCPTISSDSPGSLLKWFDGSEGNYANMDSTSSTNKVRQLYLEITPAGSGDKSWDVAIAAMTDVG